MTFESKGDAIAALEKVRSDYLAAARAAADRLARRHELITIDMVRAEVPPPKEVDPRVMGAVFKRSDWECVGYKASTRGTCHQRPVGQFRRKA